MDQWPRSAAVWVRFRVVDAADRGSADRAEVRHSSGRHGGGGAACQAGIDAAEAAATSLSAGPGSNCTLASERYPEIAKQAKAAAGEVYFWDESGFRADTVHGKTWAKRGETPVVERPGQRQSISAASAVNARGAFWYCTYEGGLTAELFVKLLKRMMRGRAKPVHLVVDGLPAHKTKLVKEYVASTSGMLTLHFLPGYAPELNPDELVWSHMKRSGVARSPLRRDEKLKHKIEAQLARIKRMPQLVRSFFQAPSVAYITDQ